MPDLTVWPAARGWAVMLVSVGARGVLTVREEVSVRMGNVRASQARLVLPMVSASLHKMGQFALVGLADVSMTMTVLTLDHCATKEDALKDLEGQMQAFMVVLVVLEDPVGLVDLLQVALETS